MRSISAEAGVVAPISPNERWEKFARATPLFIAIYFALQLAIRLLLSPNLEVDDAEMFGQTAWAWGYANSHPPLYHWLVRLCLELTGSWAAATALPKFTLLALAYFLVFDAVRRAGASNVKGALAVAALFFIPVVAWKTESKLTHSVLGFAATAAMLHALVLIQKRGKPFDFWGLGVAIAAGILAKYNFLIVLAGGFVAIFFVPEMRRAFRKRAAWLTPLVAALLIAPHLFWLRANMKLAAERLYMLRTGGGPLGLDLAAETIRDGLVSLALVLLVSTLPAILLGALTRLTSARVTDTNFLQRLCGIWLVAELGALIIAMVAGGLFQIHERYLLVLLPPFAVWIGMRLRGEALVFTLAVALALFITIARPLSVVRGSSRLAWPYREMADALRPLVDQPTAILGDRPENAANIGLPLTSASVFDARAGAARVLLIADEVETLPLLAQKLNGFAPATEVQLLEIPLRWQPQRKVRLAAQLWKIAD